MIAIALLLLAGCTKHECVMGAYCELYYCLSGPGVPYLDADCSDWDDDEDGDVDLLEVATFLAAVKP